MKRGLCLLLVTIMALGAAGGMAEEPDRFEPAGRVPGIYRTNAKNGGTVEAIEYPSKDYFKGDGKDITKSALVYLPPEYDESRQYDVLILCHGIGGSEYEWGFMSASPIGKNIIDHLILNGEITPMIIVMPNGRATAKENRGDYQSFYSFGQELRNNLLPYIDAHYATYGSLTPDDLSASRNHRAMAGLSMGGMQTINIGMCECLDLFSMFGAFSAAPTSYQASLVAKKLEAFPEDLEIRYFYSVCGTEDTTAFASAAAAAKKLPECTDRLTEDNWCWQELPGKHDFGIWYLGLYNMARIMGALHED